MNSYFISEWREDAEVVGWNLSVEQQGCGDLLRE